MWYVSLSLDYRVYIVHKQPQNIADTAKVCHKWSKLKKKEIQRSCDSRALKRNSFSFVLQEQLFHRHATFTFNQNIAVAQLQHQQKQIAEQTQKSWMKKDNNNCGYTGSIPFKLCQRFFLMIARDILYEMSECFVVFQIFVAHLERRSIRFWWFCAHFNLLVFGEKIWWKDIFCFLFSGRFLKLFFGRISILFFLCHDKYIPANHITK